MQRLKRDDAAFLDFLWSQTDHGETISHRRDQLVYLLARHDRKTDPNQPKVQRIIWWAAQYGFQDRYYGVEHGPKVAYATPSRTGLIPKRYAHRPVDPKTGKANGYIQYVMVDFLWPVFHRELGRIEEQWIALGRNVDVLYRIRDLEKKYPQTQTPREACVLEGIDPDVLLDFA